MGPKCSYGYQLIDSMLTLFNDFSLREVCALQWKPSQNLGTLEEVAKKLFFLKQSGKTFLYTQLDSGGVAFLRLIFYYLFSQKVRQNSRTLTSHLIISSTLRKPRHSLLYITRYTVTELRNNMLLTSYDYSSGNDHNYWSRVQDLRHKPKFFEVVQGGRQNLYRVQEGETRIFIWVQEGVPEFFFRTFSAFSFKDTCYVWGKKQQSLQLLDILACNSAN